MAKVDTVTFWGALFALDLYKRNQGRLARQLTAAGLGVIVLVGVYVLSQGPLSAFATPVRVGIPAGIAILAGWLIFRLVNFPAFAEFLISVEGEMNKVSWDSREQLVRATVVVLGTMLFLAVVLYVYDFIWVRLLGALGVIQA